MAPAAHTAKSRRIETGPFEYMTIDWFFEEVDGRTRMRWVQDFSMKPNAPANDEQAEDYMNRNTKIQMDAIKERLEASAVHGWAPAHARLRRGGGRPYPPRPAPKPPPPVPPPPP